MAGKLTNYFGQVNSNICEYVVDNASEIENLPTTTKVASGEYAKDDCFGKKLPCIGSTCICGNEGSDLEVYMLFSFGWKKL